MTSLTAGKGKGWVFKVVEDEDGDEDDAPAREGEGSGESFGVSSMPSPIPPFGEASGEPLGAASVPPRTILLYSSKTMRDEYQIGPSCSSISVTGSPFFRPLRGTNTIGAHFSPASAPLRTPFSTSLFNLALVVPTACAISAKGQRAMPYSSWSCSTHMTSIQMPFSSCVHRFKLLFEDQSSG